jgi:hypothetical protein
VPAFGLNPNVAELAEVLIEACNIRAYARKTTRAQRRTLRGPRERPNISAVLNCLSLPTDMLLSKEYVGYLARETVKRLAASEFIETKSLPVVTEKVHAAMLEELGLEDRINDEVRVILEAYSDEMRNTGANYQEMFRKVKNELVRKYRAVL